MTDPTWIREQLDRYTFHHTIQVADGIFTPGKPEFQWRQQPVLKEIRSWDLTGQRVLDVGCQDGLFSFEAERRGAREVLAIDQTISRGAVEVVIPALQSKVCMRQMSVYDLDPGEVGQFDVVLFAAVLNHLRYPFWALRRIRDVMCDGGTLLLETGAFLGSNDRAMLFCPTGEESPYDASSCTFFNLKGLVDTLDSLGFTDVRFPSILRKGADLTASEHLDTLLTGHNTVIGRVTALCTAMGPNHPRRRPMLQHFWNGTSFPEFAAPSSHATDPAPSGEALSHAGLIDTRPGLFGPLLAHSPHFRENEDVVLATFPRSGTTWTMHLLRSLKLWTVEGYVQDLSDLRPDPTDAASTPRIIKSHEYYHSRLRRAIYLVRDPRDCVVSYYHYRRRTLANSGRPLATMPSLSAFVRESPAPGALWAKHVASWLGAGFAGEMELCVIRYEELHSAPHVCLERMLTFLEIDRSAEQVAQAVKMMEFENLARREQSRQNAPLEDTNLAFYRRGIVGGWRDELNTEDVRYIEEDVRSLMATLGYSSS